MLKSIKDRIKAHGQARLDNLHECAWRVLERCARADEPRKVRPEDAYTKRQLEEYSQRKWSDIEPFDSKTFDYEAYKRELRRESWDAFVHSSTARWEMWDEFWLFCRVWREEKAKMRQEKEQESATQV